MEVLNTVSLFIWKHKVGVFVNNQLDAQSFFLFLYLFIPVLYMFRATKC